MKTKAKKTKKHPEVSTIKVWELDAVVAYIFGTDQEKIGEFFDEFSDSDVSTNGDAQTTIIDMEMVGTVGEHVDKDFRERTEFKLLCTLAETRNIEIRV